MGFMHYDPQPMTRQEAEELLKQTTLFDYLKGRVMKVDLSGDVLDPRLYDRDNGEGAAERALAELRSTGDANSSSIQATHQVNTLASAEDTRAHLGEKSRLEDDGRGASLHLGLSDVAGKLKRKMNKVIGKRR